MFEQQNENNYKISKYLQTKNYLQKKSNNYLQQERRIKCVN